MPIDHSSPERLSPDRSRSDQTWSLVEVRPGQFEIAGEIDAHSAPLVADGVEAGPGPELVLDLSGVTFMDSSGLRVIVQLHQRALAGGPELVIAHPSRPVVRLFELGGLSDLLQFDNS